MKGRVGGGQHKGGVNTDLLVCFPTRAHLTLMPKAICSPSRTSESSKRHPSRPRAIRGHGSPLFRSRTKHMSSAELDDEPTSPKVTCAGQIKVQKPTARHSTGCRDKDWLSVVEEIERIRKQRKRPKPSWMEALGLKKDVLQLLGAIRGFRLGMGCFGSFPGAGAATDCSTDEEDGDDEEDDDEEEELGRSDQSRTIFSKWFMVLEEENKDDYDDDCGFKKPVEEEKERDGSLEFAPPASSAPPANALLLMRCRSAPAKGWLEGKGGEEEGGGGEMISAMKKREEEKEKERMVLMSYAPDFFKLSTDIVEETWVVGAVDPLARCRSWKR